MALSLLEYGLLALVGYGAVAMLLTTLVREPAGGQGFSVMRIAYLLPGLFALTALGSLGPLDDCQTAGGGTSECVPAIVLSEQVVPVELPAPVPVGGLAWGGGECLAGNGTHCHVGGAAVREVIRVEQATWAAWHYGLGALLLITIFVQALQLLTKPGESPGRARP